MLQVLPCCPHMQLPRLTSAACSLPLRRCRWRPSTRAASPPPSWAAHRPAGSGRLAAWGCMLVPGCPAHASGASCTIPQPPCTRNSSGAQCSLKTCLTHMALARSHHYLAALIRLLSASRPSHTGISSHGGDRRCPPTVMLPPPQAGPRRRVGWPLHVRVHDPRAGHQRRGAAGGAARGEGRGAGGGGCGCGVRSAGHGVGQGIRRSGGVCM